MRPLILGFALVFPLSAAADAIPDGQYEGRGDGTRAILQVSGASASVAMAGLVSECVGGIKGNVSETAGGWLITDGVCSLDVQRTGSGYSFMPTNATESACFGYGGQGCSLMGEVVLTAAGSSEKAASYDDPEYKDARCELVVNGRTYGEGDCRFYPSTEGSFQIHFPSGIFADVNVEGGGQAIGYWTGPLPASHAHDDLGRLKRDDACWVNDKVRVCAW